MVFTVCCNLIGTVSAVMSSDTNELLRWTLGLRRKLVVPVKNPTRILIPRRMTPTCRDKLRPPRCEFFAGVLRVPCTEHLQRTRNERVRSLSRHVGVILLSGGWGSMWGSSRGLQVFYVIPGSGVIVQIYIEKNWSLHDVQGDQLNMVVCFWYLVKSDF